MTDEIKAAEERGRIRGLEEAARLVCGVCRLDMCLAALQCPAEPIHIELKRIRGNYGA